MSLPVYPVPVKKRFVEAHSTLYKCKKEQDNVRYEKAFY